MELLKQALSKTDGYKTYAIAALMVALGLLQGDQKMVMDGIAFVFIRRAIPAK